MKRIPFYIILIAVTFLAPVRRVNVSQLEPVEALLLVREGQRVTVTTDTGASGSGQDALTALQDLEKTTPAVVYLDTAAYLLISQSAAADVEQLRGRLKDSVKLCLLDGTAEAKDAVEYLRLCEDLPKLRHWSAGQPLPVLSAPGQ